jgi:hypothetical protein
VKEKQPVNKLTAAAEYKSHGRKAARPVVFLNQRKNTNMNKEHQAETECEGHPAGPFDPMGRTVYCDGSCVKMDFPSILQSAEDARRTEAK